MAQDNLPAIFFTDNFGIRTTDFDKVLDAALGEKADYADLFFEYRRNEGVSLEEGLVKNCSQSTANGVGVRVLAESKTGYAYTDDITIENLELAARTAQYIAQNRSSQVPAPVGQLRGESHDLYPVKTPVNDVALEKKVALLYEIDKFTRGLDPRVKNVFASIGAEYKVMLVANSQGLVVGDIQPLTRFNVTCIVEENGNRQIGSFGGGGRVEFGFFVDNKDYERYAREAVRQAVLNLERDDAPAGTMEVVLGPGWPGILLHEAIGHGLEADFNRKKTSAFSDRIGQRVASRAVHGGRRRHHAVAARLAQRRRRGHADAANRPDRERHSQGLSAGQAQCWLDEDAAHRQRPARKLRAHSHAAHDQYFHAGGRDRRRRTSFAR